MESQILWIIIFIIIGNIKMLETFGMNECLKYRAHTILEKDFG